MALITYPLNNIEYSAEDAELFHITRESGIYAKNSFDYSVTGADNNIVIGKGIGWIKNGEFSGKVIAQKEAISLDMGVSDPNYTRIDAVVIQFDANSNETSIVVKKGTATTNPVAPPVVQTEAVYELHLYHIQREAGSLYITPNKITDLRLNKLYCGLMADSVTSIDTSAIDKQVSGLIKSLQSEIASVKDGSAYLPKDGSSPMNANLSMGDKKIINLATPTADRDATTKKYTDDAVGSRAPYYDITVSGAISSQTVADAIGDGTIPAYTAFIAKVASSDTTPAQGVAVGSVYGSGPHATFMFMHYGNNTLYKCRLAGTELTIKEL